MSLRAVTSSPRICSGAMYASVPSEVCDFVSSDAMASDLRDFYITRFKDAGRRVQATLYLDNLELEEGDVVELESPSSAIELDGIKLHVEDVSFRPGSLAAGRPDELYLRAREA